MHQSFRILQKLVLDLRLTRGHGLDLSLQFEYLIPNFLFESPWRILFRLFESACVYMGPHVRDGVKT